VWSLRSLNPAGTHRGKAIADDLIQAKGVLAINESRVLRSTKVAVGGLTSLRWSG
jgi:hypothetical protein